MIKGFKLNKSHLDFIEKQKKRTEQCLNEYLANPKKCLYCEEAISFEKRSNKFCNSSCAASYNNKGILRNKKYYEIIRLQQKDKEKICLHCNKTFYPKRKRQKYCSIKCGNEKGRKDLKEKIEKEERFKKYNVPITQLDEYQSLNKERFGWKIEGIVKKDDYLYAIVKEHPNAIKHGYVLLHRIIMENHLERLLNADEVVHHINGNKFDNRIENLQLTDNKKHASYHGKLQGKKYVLAKCPMCKKEIVRAHNKTFLGGYKSNHIFCSKECSRQFQLKSCNGITPELEKAISENIVRIFKRFPDNSEQTLDNEDA